MKTTNNTLEAVLDLFFDRPYPDYNMGLLPDEEGYDAVQAQRNFEEDYARDEAKAQMQALVKESIPEKYVYDEGYVSEDMAAVANGVLSEITQNLKQKGLL